MTSLIKNDQEISVFDISENRKKNVKVSEVVEIIEARVYEIFSLCKALLDKAGISIPQEGCVVMTGAGISYVDGCRRLAREVFDLPVRVVQAGQIPGVLKPEFVASAGMIRYVANVRKGVSRASEIRLRKQEKQKNEGSVLERILNFFKKMF